jgi:hypothetical protein
VLLVDGEPGNEPRDSEVFFLKNALVPVPPEAAEDYFIKTATISSPELSLARLDDFDAVVLANVPDFSESTLQSVESYLRRGGGLIIFPGERVNPTFYNEQLFKRSSFLPAALGQPRGASDGDDRFITLQERNYEHPIVDLWNDPASGKLASARFFKYFDLQPVAVAVGGGRATSEGGADSLTPPHAATPAPGEALSDAGVPRMVLKFADGTPAVMERNWGLGRVVLFSSTADTAWNDLAVRPAFVPLMHRTLGAAVQRQDEGLNLRVGEKFARRVNPEFLDKDATFFKPRQVDVVRDLRRIELVNGWPTVQFDQTDWAGLYDVSVNDPPLALKFAAQPDAAESSLEELSPAQRGALKDVADWIDWTPNLSLRGMVEKERTGLEFWVPLAVLALVLALVETGLGQWFTRSK